MDYLIISPCRRSALLMVGNMASTSVKEQIVLLHLSPSCEETQPPTHTDKQPFPPLFAAHIDHLSRNGMVTEAKSQPDPALSHNNSFFNWPSLPIPPQPLFICLFAENKKKIRDGVPVDARWVYDFES